MGDHRRPIRLVRTPSSPVPFDGLRPWDEVARIWFLRSGERLTRQGIRAVAAVAMRKLRRAVLSDPTLAAEIGMDHEEDDDHDERHSRRETA